MEPIPFNLSHISIIAFTVFFKRGTANNLSHPWDKMGLPRWHKWLRIHLPSRRHGFDPCIGKIPWSRKSQPTPVFLPEKFHGQRNLMGYSPWSHKELGTTEYVSTWDKIGVKNSFISWMLQIILRNLKWFMCSSLIWNSFNIASDQQRNVP